MARSRELDRHIAFQRFGLGARKGHAVDDARAALISEIADPARALITEAEILAAGAPPGSSIDPAGKPPLMSGQAMFALHLDEEERVRQQRDARKAAAQAGSMETAPAPPAMAAPTPNNAMAAPRVGELFYRREAMARMLHAITQPVGLVERLVMFWSNHFAVSVQKGLPLRALAGPFEREAIRPHVLGRFEDMLLAVEQHPAMLIFLDNRASVGPASKAGQNRRRGLNENLAREILELHTLGVNGGYTQTDVTALARIITGWTVAGREGQRALPGGFTFNTNAHEPGAHALLGNTYGEQGIEQGVAALRDLARHPATAGHIARKLVRHFVADAAPNGLVSRLEAIFRQTKGDLAKVVSTLIESSEAWDAPLTKLRAPYEGLVATYRAFDRQPQQPGEINGPLNAAGQPLWGPQGPNGYADDAASVAAPEAMKTRLETAAAAARRFGGSVNPLHLADELFGPGLSQETRAAIARAESKPQGHALLLMSPEFLRR